MVGRFRRCPRNGGGGRSEYAVFIQQLGRMSRMFNDSDDDSNDEDGDEPIVNIAQMIGRVLNGFVSGEGGEG